MQYEVEKLGPAANQRMLTESRIAVVLFGVGSVALGAVFLMWLPSLLELLFVVFGLQNAMAVIVVRGLFGAAKGSEKMAAIASVVGGAVAVIVCLVMALYGVTLVGLSTAFWSPIFALTVSAICFFFFVPRSPTSVQPKAL